MRAVIQRVARAQVDIEGETVGSIGRGLVILLGVGHNDTEAEVERLWSKISRLRIFEDADGKTNLSLADVAGEVLVVSQFTLFADCKKGNRPSFTEAGAPDEANRLYECFIERARRDVPRVETGRFGAYMDVSLVNDGPFTLWLDTDTL
ncbi:MULTISPECIES: D-aminoacyl-tRNA deacylase [Gordonibacter]|uniref:D-aminoacyl-tRNA deacylase n=1 Tax=Gordonibacter faecis TaxID=3047475 RepID=A0ABT7DMK3_9ACTN|nr:MULTISPECIES: D-aminoacyl-tRNA deacylase [unclassified Gordonibacter]MDJ1650477.1 D-aminoacyl-tRNA deacylase [Gordonibacter sp. KGMB12511]HIW77403.1 D-tyrosyl-tRNA(Tyr) deacylase [Candidatus Gordonibacter avicola]